MYIPVLTKIIVNYICPIMDLVDSFTWLSISYLNDFVPIKFQLPFTVITSTHCPLPL